MSTNDTPVLFDVNKRCEKIHRAAFSVEHIWRQRCTLESDHAGPCAPSAWVEA